jgi:hypothetical protein
MLKRYIFQAAYAHKRRNAGCRTWGHFLIVSQLIFDRRFWDFDYEMSSGTLFLRQFRAIFTNLFFVS